MKIKPFLKRNWKKIVTLGVIFGLAINILTACAKKENTVDPGTEPVNEVVTPVDPKPTDPVTPIVTPGNPTDPVVEPTDPTEQSDPVVEPTDPTEPTDPVVEPTDPTNPENPNPDDPQVDPQPTKLDFSGLEEKLVNVFEEKIRGNVVNNFTYSIKDETLYVVYDYSGNNRTSVAVCGYVIGENEEFSTQSDIDKTVDVINKKNFNLLMSVQKSKTDITANGETYSKDGIEGDNIFARRCGVENASMTYISNLGSQTFADTNTGYGKIIGILNLTNENKVVLKKFVVEYYSGYSDEQCYENLLNDQTSYLNDEEFIDLGESIDCGLDGGDSLENGGSELSD